MKNLKVSTKLFVGFGIAIMFILAVGIVSIVRVNDLNDDYSHSIDTHGQPLGDAAHILESIQSLRAELRLSILYTGQEEKVRATEALINGWCAKFEEGSKAFGNHLVLPATRENYAKA
ncbi:MAG: MCP four helix bundle domain-containing protein, partial [Chitinispirillales bacterium]|nr:MCP four helix bundle domain-containing protein [Chitinispirillales bacterium]